MNSARLPVGFLLALLSAASARAEVRISVQNSNGVAWVNYECTAGELVRAFALDVSADIGQIVGISNFFRGPCTPSATGYGIFPASFRDHTIVGAGTNINWSAADYTPLAVPADAPGDTLPGLNSSGVTLEFGGLWDPTAPATMPRAAGTLCALTLSHSAFVSVAPNLTRGGVVSAFAENTISPVFSGAVIMTSAISATLQNGAMTILFTGGELQTAISVDGPWTGTGDFSGEHTESLGTNLTRFYRVHSP
jgi:hypothetical protein